METIKEDSFILVYRDRRKKWLVRPVDTPKLHTHLGILDCAGLVGRPFGTVASTTMNDSVYILKPTLEDIVMKFARRTQVIYPKDLAMIVMHCGIHSGSRVFEAGTGSGAATATFAYMVAPEGHVYSYDLNAEFQDVARKNLEKFGLMGSVYAHAALGVANPRVAIISNGEERSKGNAQSIEAAALLARAPLHFIGNVEGKDVLSSVADVVVADGFVGNVMLKLAEGVAAFFQVSLNEAFANASPLAKLGGLLSRPAFAVMKKKLD